MTLTQVDGMTIVIKNLNEEVNCQLIGRVKIHGLVGILTMVNFLGPFWLTKVKLGLHALFKALSHDAIIAIELMRN